MVMINKERRQLYISFSKSNFTFRQDIFTVIDDPLEYSFIKNSKSYVA
jgi:hypothetical protein